jgi:hypothetical protein
MRAGVFLVTVLTAAAVAATTAPASSSRARTAPSAWTHAICTSIAAWERQVTKRAGGLQSLNSAGAAKVKKKLVAFLGGVVTDTQTLINSVKKAGTPAIPHGADAAGAVQRGLLQTKVFFARDLAQAKKLPVKPVSKFAAGASRLGASLDAQGTKVAAIFDSLDKRYPSIALAKAMKRDPACRILS